MRQIHPPFEEVGACDFQVPVQRRFEIPAEAHRAVWLWDRHYWCGPFRPIDLGGDPFPLQTIEFCSLYCRFVDDCWAYFADEDCALEFKRKLDNLHPALKFTCEFELNASLPFLDDLVERVVDGGFVTTVYRKPTFTGMCFKWDSFCPVKCIIGLIRCLVNRALRICSVEKLSGELDFLRDMFLKNGYPAGIVNKHITTDLI